MNRFDPPGGRPWGLFALCGVSILLNIVLGTRLMLSPDAPPTLHEAVQPQLHAAIVTDAVEAPVPEQPAVEEAAELPENMHHASLTVKHSLARTFQDGIGEGGDEVAAVVARLFVWDLNLRRDLQAGDKIDVVWEGSGPSLSVVAARYTSKKLGTLEAYRYTPTGEVVPRWWTSGGLEVSRTLKNGPIEGYEQITSLLKDRPRHRGMDFKAAVGTAVTSGRAGTITRTNWNRRANGNCVEVEYGDGTMARYLHLSSTDVRPGQRVAAGEVVGTSGNTGRSTAPHLHYELSKNDKVIDPVDYHGVFRHTLPEAERASFESELARLEGLLER